MKTTIIAAILAIAPALGFAMGCSGNHGVDMTCAEGTEFDASAGKCMPLNVG